MSLRLSRLLVAAAVSSASIALVHVAPLQASVSAPFDSSYASDGQLDFSVPLQDSVAYAMDTLVDGSGRQVVLTWANADHDNPQTFISRYLANGTIDSTFGSGGRSVALPVRSPNMAMQPDGGFIVAGFTIGPNNQGGVAVYRVTASGALDSTFGVNGRFHQNELPGRYFGEGRVSVAISSSNGNTIIVGFEISNPQNSNNNIYFIALRFNGQVNRNWGTNGGIEVAPELGYANPRTSLHSIRFFSNDSFIAVGSSQDVNNVRQVLLIKINANGGFDETFDGSNVGNGIVKFGFSTKTEAIMSGILITPQDEIVLAGFAGDMYTGPWYYGFTKVLSDGTVDTSFGTNGFALSSVQSIWSDYFPQTISVQNDGRYVFPITTSSAAGFLRISSIGSYSGGQGCSQCLWSPNGLLPQAGSLSNLNDGKVMIAGFLSSSKKPVLFRFLETGVVDSSFPHYVIPTNYEDFELNTMSSQRLPDGSVFALLDGSVGDEENASEYPVLFKITPSGSLDTQFGTNGYVILRPASRQVIVLAEDFDVQSDGKILVLATAKEYGEQDANMLWRLNENGSLDSSFGTNGVQTTRNGSFNFRPQQILAGANGKIYVSAEFEQSNSYYPRILRYNSNGSLDTSFTDANNFAGAISPTNSSATGNMNALYKGASSSIFVTWEDQQNGAFYLNLSRLTSSGAIDQTFANGRMSWRIDEGNSVDYISKILVGPNNKIFLLAEESSPTSTMSIIQLNENGTLNTNFAGSGRFNFTFVDPQTVDFVYGNDMALTSNGVYAVGYGRVSNDESTRFFTIAKITSAGALDMSFANNGVYRSPSGMGNYVSSITQVSGDNAVLLGRSNQNDTRFSWMRLVNPSAAPTTTSPPTTAPTTTTPPTTAPPTTTTVPTVNAETSDEIKLVISVSQAAVLKRMKLAVPSGSKVTMRSTSAKVCRVVKTRVLASATGTCRISVTITDKKKKKTTKSTSFKVS